jgi:hypothetical protein
MNHSSKLVAFVLFGLACGPSRLIGNLDAGTGNAESESSSSSETSTSDTSTSDPDPSTSTFTTNSSGTMILLPNFDDVWEYSCDPFAQDCPDGEKCVPHASSGGDLDDNKCVPVLGDQAPGEACTYGGPVESTDDCDATSFCWDMNEGGTGICRSFCTGTIDMPACPDNYFCTITSAGTITLCFPTCDPVAQDCDVDGLGCYFSGTEFTCIAPMDPPGLPPGEACEWANACEIGSLCLDAAVLPNCAGVSCCGEFCDLGLGDAQCVAVPGTVCTSFYEQGTAPEGFEHVGVCILPP